MKIECIHISGFTHKEDTLTRHGPSFMECDGTYPYSGSNQQAYITNKHNHLKKMRGWDTRNNN